MRLVSRCFSFILILFLILLVLSYIVTPKNNVKEAGMRDVTANGILGEKEDSIDVLVVGNSLSYTSIVPMEIWKDYGFSMYINGTPAQVLTDSLEFTFNSMKHQKPKIVILETDTIFGNIGLSSPVKKLITQALPVLEYHDRWKSLKFEDFFSIPDYTWTDDFKGYYFSDKTISCDYYDYMKPSKKFAEISKANKIYIKILNEYCKLNDAQLILLSTPNAKDWNDRKHNVTDKFAKENGIEFLDLNVLNDYVGIDWETDTRDGGIHLNHLGAVKVTKYLGKYLEEKDILTDHREDEEYSSWNESLKRYLEKTEG